MAFSRTFAVLAAASALVAGCGHHTAHPPRPSTSTSSKPVAAPAPPVCADPSAVPATLNIRDKLAQLLMVGVTERRRRPRRRQRPPRRRHLHRQLDRPVDASRRLAGRHHGQGAGPLPLAVSVDEEGGRVSRLAVADRDASRRPASWRRRKPSEQVHDIALPTAARKMHDLGITVDFAPVVDVTDEPDDTVIGDRSFGADPTTVTDYAGAYAQGLRDAGLLPVLKHFPGHGHGSGDSHTGRCRHAAAGRSAEQRPGAVPHAGHRRRRSP